VNSGPGSGAIPTRRLTTHQIAVLVQVLLSFPGQRVGVGYLRSTSDAATYAADFLTIFKALDWVADSQELPEDFGSYPSGLAIVSRDGQLPPSAEALRDALRIYRLEAETRCGHSDLCGPRAFVLAVL
jgi:hypothetical protein